MIEDVVARHYASDNETISNGSFDCFVQSSNLFSKYKISNVS